MSHNTWQTWLIYPHAPLVFRDGRPFTAVPGARAKTLAFPFPSTVAGAVRTRSGAFAHGGIFPKGDAQAIERVKSYRIVGPFLFSVTKKALLLPAPQDALLTSPKSPSDKEKEAFRTVLQPTDRFARQGVVTNLPQGLQMVAPIQSVKEKPHPKAPRFWYWEPYKDWLIAPRSSQEGLADLGIGSLPLDVRTHVSIQAATGTAEEGALFQTEGLVFAHAPTRDDYPGLEEVQEFALVLQTDAQNLQPGIDTLGGERRLVSWEKASISLPSCPDEVREAILTTHRGRLVLATPAVFEKGFLPTWIMAEHPSGVKLRIVGAAVGRPEHVSGWDYEKHAPKATRRLAPAGSVYFFEIEEGDEEAVKRFIEEVWFAPISDAEQDRRDGFGIALLGAWNKEED